MWRQHYEIIFLLTKLSGYLFTTCDIEEQGAIYSQRGASYNGTIIVSFEIYNGETGWEHTKGLAHRHIWAIKLGAPK